MIQLDRHGSTKFISAEHRTSQNIVRKPVLWSYCTLGTLCLAECLSLWTLRTNCGLWEITFYFILLKNFSMVIFIIRLILLLVSNMNIWRVKTFVGIGRGGEILSGRTTKKNFFCTFPNFGTVKYGKCVFLYNIAYGH